MKIYSKNFKQFIKNSHHIDFSTFGSEGQVFSVHKDSSDMNYFEIYFKFHSGSYNDPSGKEGLHHLLEHLMLDKYLLKSLPELGVSINAYTTYDSVYFILKGPYIHNSQYGLLCILGGFLESIVNETYTNADVEAEKAVIISEYEKWYSSDETKFFEFLANNHYNLNHPYKRFVLGTPNSLKNISTFDLNKHFIQYFNFNNLDIFIYSEAPQFNYQSFLSVLNSLLSNRKIQGERFKFPYKVFDLVNPKQTELIYKNPASNDGLVSLTLKYLINLPINDQRIELWERFFNQVVSPDFLVYMRSKLSLYSARSYIDRLYNKCFINFYVEAVDSDNLNLQDCIISYSQNIFQEEAFLQKLSSFMQKEKIRNDHIPTSLKRMFDKNIDLIFRYNTFLNITDTMTTLLGKNPNEYMDILKEIQTGVIFKLESHS
jgi:hypothetical protein